MREILVQYRCPRVYFVILDRELWTKTQIHEVIILLLQYVANATQCRVERIGVFLFTIEDSIVVHVIERPWCNFSWLQTAKESR
jgi:hypothetical protein